MAMSAFVVFFLAIILFAFAAKWWTYGLAFNVTTLTLYVTFLTLLTYLVLVGIDFDLRPNLRQFSVNRIKKHKPDLLAGNVTRIGPVDLYV